MFDLHFNQMNIFLIHMIPMAGPENFVIRGGGGGGGGGGPSHQKLTFVMLSEFPCYRKLIN